MAARFGDFMFGLVVTIGQAAVFGMLALWLASRRSRLARIISGLCMVSAAWMSVVPVIDRFAGYPARSDIDSNLLTIFALAVGWTAGRNQRLSASSAQPGHSTPPRLVLDGFVRSIGSWIVRWSQLYGIVAGLFGLFVILAIVSQSAQLAQIPDETYMLGELVDKLPRVLAGGQLDGITRGLKIAKVFQNKEGHVVVSQQKFDRSNYREIEAALGALYSRAFNQTLKVRFSLKPQEKGMWNVQ